MIGFPAIRQPLRALTPGQQLKRNDELRRLELMRRTYPAPYRSPTQPATRTVYRTIYQPGRTVVRQVPVFRYRNDWSREQNERERIRLQALQLQLQQQQMQMQQLAVQAPMTTAPQVATAPGSPATDLTPMQDEHAAEGGEEPAHPHSNHKLLLFGGLVVVAGVGAYMVMHKKKPSSKP